MSRVGPELRRLALRSWPFVLVTALGLWLLWPVPAGVMPLSADHTVHLARAWLYGQQLAAGHVIGWSPFWFFGFPLGELYPPLGDLLVVAARTGSGGLLSWSGGYALAFTLVFLLQGWVLLRCGRALGLGPLPGLVAACLALLDVGAYREGGWIYTVGYGVWPQALATSLAWLALAELALAARAREARDATAAATGDASPPSMLTAGECDGAGSAGASAPRVGEATAAADLAAGDGPASAGSSAPRVGEATAAADLAASDGPASAGSPAPRVGEATAAADLAASDGPARAGSPTPRVGEATAAAAATSSTDTPGGEAGARVETHGTASHAARGGAPGRARSWRHVLEDLVLQACHESHAPSHRHLAVAALAVGAALLAHPMSLPMFALAAPLWLVTVGLRGAGVAPSPVRRERLAAALLDLALVVPLGLGLAAWWLWPMSAHAGYMASYGWLHAPLEAMLQLLRKGQWTQLMAPLAGYAALVGLALAALSRGGVLRFFALWSLVHWLLASTDVFWALRLDRLSAGFSHIQYQRFLTAAKPGLYLLAGAVVGALWVMARRTWSPRAARRALSVALVLGALGLGTALLRDAWALARRHGVGVVQVERVPGDPAFARAYEQFLAWAAQTWQRRDADYRIAVRADRNAHWFMDSPVYTGTPLYKIGFTPGDNFVHKPESGAPALLDRLQVRYVLTHGNTVPGAKAVASFGSLRVFERASAEGLAHIEGTGALTVESADPSAGLVRVRVEGAAADSRLVFHIAGYPRWDLSLRSNDGTVERVEWFEVPALGQGELATPEQRRRGELRGGKALGDDGTEPTLLAADARDGTYELRYVRWRWFDVAGLLAGLAAAAFAVLLYMSDRARARLLPLARRAVHPVLLAVLGALVLTLAGLRWRASAIRERPLASAWLAAGRAAGEGVQSGPLKTDMTIFPAVIADPRRPSEVIFDDVDLGPALDGWIALDDDDAKQRRRGSYRVEWSARRPGATDWSPLAAFAVPHRPDRVRLESRVRVPEDMRGPADLRVVITPSGEAPPRLGFDLTLAPRG